MPRRSRGPTWIGLALVVVALVFGAWGVVVAGASDVDPAAVAVAVAPAAAESAGTPVISARRVPDLLVSAVSARRLAAAAAPALDALPDTSCATVVDGDRVLVERRSGDAYLPASSQKLFVALAALRHFGADTRFATSAQADAEPRGGVVEGDLWLVGGGDPLITTDPYLPTIRYGPPPHTRLEALADSIVAAGVGRIAGSVVGDDSRYDGERFVPTWRTGYVRDGEVGPLTALSVNDGRTYPAQGPTAGGAQPAADPPAYAAGALTDLLRARGVAVGGPPRSGASPDDATEIARQESLTVGEIVGEMLLFSDNNTAELLTKELAASEGGTGSTAAGTEVVRRELGEAGVDTTSLEVVDGSGLDRANRATCTTLVETLVSDGPDGPIAAGLPVANQSGTLTDRFRQSPAAGKVRAKTGSLEGVSSLAGWVRTDAGRDLAFAVVINGVDVGTARQLAQRVTESLLSYPDGVDPAAVAPIAGAA